ncbi:MAG: tetratricopeptide repeat protein [Bacteroidales bacterium]|nr:tetratricopeptide repeat protein [Bacteroidales bacterium]
MKAILLAICIMVPFTGIFGSTDSLYRSAITHYEEGRYDESLQQYREILARGVESPVLYYNMGNAAYRSNHLGYAILYYEKALKLDPGFEDAAYNLRFVSQFKSDRFEEVPELFIKRWFNALITGVSERVWAVISITAFFLLLTGILFYIFARGFPLKKTGFFSAVVFLVIFGFSAFAASVQRKNITEPDKAIIIAPTVFVKSSPSESGNDLFILHEGTRVEMEEEVSGWRNIRIVDGRTGWIPGDSFLPV